MAPTIIANEVSSSGTSSYVEFTTAADQIEVSGVFHGAEAMIKVSIDGGTTWAYATGPDGRPLRIRAPSRLPISMLAGDYLALQVTHANSNTEITAKGLP